ncbi:hypothetical protein [Labilibaculum manganireducens]|uniref:hypothetical protein n=1 Tax=Labilibaculum manganireducens TaxID=1940525 RepID=UPI0029F556EB|nr:hypothetical protein [Labilibaculum manganireducens]
MSKHLGMDVSYLSFFIEKTNIVKSGNVRDCDILKPQPGSLLKGEGAKPKLFSLLLQEKDRLRYRNNFKTSPQPSPKREGVKKNKAVFPSPSGEG